MSTCILVGEHKTWNAELGTAFQLQPLGTAKKAELGTANIFPAKCAELGTPNLERQNLERQKSRTWNGEHFYNNFTLITVLPHYLWHHYLWHHYFWQTSLSLTLFGTKTFSNSYFITLFQPHYLWQTSLSLTLFSRFNSQVTFAWIFSLSVFLNSNFTMIEFR